MIFKRSCVQFSMVGLNLLVKLCYIFYSAHILFGSAFTLTLLIIVAYLRVQM